MEDDFGHFLNDRRAELEKHQQAMEAVHKENKFYSNPNVTLKFKHENVFPSYLWTKDDENLRIGFLSENDPYEANAFEVLRARWISDSKKLYGDFVPSHGARELCRPNRKQLPEIVGYIKRRLLADWSDINFIIGTNPEDYIELRFSASSLDAPSGLKAYMSNLVDQDESMLKFQLRRVPQYWGLKSGKKRSKSERSNSEDLEENPLMTSEEENYLYYMLAPAWARQKNPILYL